MRLDKFGDSYDIVKQSLLRWLAPCGPWIAHPMFTEQVDPLKAESFSRFLGVCLLTTQTLHRDSDRSAYFSVPASCVGHVFLDPNTGLRVPSASLGEAPDFVSGTELVTLAQAHPDQLVLVFDQSIDRRYPSKGQIEAKLTWLAERGIHGVAYVSHACFVLVSATESVLDTAIGTLLRESRLPDARLIRSPQKSGRRGIFSPAPHTTQHAGPHWAVHHG
jgi:hypothetical protein